jgi:flagellar motor switch protein FliM
MADERLSEAELQTLLAGRTVPRAESAAGPRLADLPDAAPVPDWLGNVQRRFAEDTTAALSALVRRTARVRLQDLAHRSGRDWLARCDQPTCICVLAAPGLNGAWLLEFSPTILFAIFDCMLGGSGQPSAAVRRPLTEIELRLCGRLTALVLGQLHAAWGVRLPHELQVERIECDARSLHGIVPADDAITVDFEVALASVAGRVSLCLPADAARTQVEAQRRPVELVAVLAEMELDSADVAALEPGDMIGTEQSAAEPIGVWIGGQLRFHARAGALAGRKAVELTSRAARGQP